MIRATWILAICGALGIAFSASFADDTLFQSNSGFNLSPSTDVTNASSDDRNTTTAAPADRRAAAEYFSRSGQTSQTGGRTTATPPTLGNLPGRYERTDNPFARPTEPVLNGNVELIGSPRSTSGNIRTIGGTTPSTTGVNAGRVPLSLDRGQFPSGAGTGIRQANFEGPAGSSGNIRQVGATAETNPFETLPPIDNRPAATTTRPIPNLPTIPDTPTAPSFGVRTPATPSIPGRAGTAPITRTIVAATGLQVPTVSLEWVKDGSINVGQPCECSLVVRNNGKADVADIEVDAYFPVWVRVTDADPKPSDTVERLAWKLSSLKAGESTTINVTLVPTKRGKLTTKAFVRFTAGVAGVFDVEEPLLQVKVEGPKEVMVGEPASQIITVTNPGTGTTESVSIKAQIPKGLKHVRGEELEMKVGSLGAGESRSVRLALVASEGGVQSLDIVAESTGGLIKKSKITVNVIAPSLQVAVAGPGLRYLNRTANYTVSVVNTGTVASNNVRAKYKVPDGFTFNSADHGGKYDAKQHSVSWFVGRLDTGDATKFQVNLTAAKLGDFVHRAGAVSEHGAIANAESKTKIDGVSSLVLEIVDLDDPVEVGAETAYEIRIRNEGSRAAQNVGISCELAKGSQLIGAKGPSKHIADKNLLVFKSLPELGAGKTAVYRVQVKGIEAGNQRFQVRLMSDSIQEPLIFQELTKFYQE